MNYSFDSTYAHRYGVSEAILLANIIFWIRKNKANGKHFHDGKTWTYNSSVAFAKLFPFWSASQVKRILKSLLDQGVIVAGNYNKAKMDQTRWFAVTCEDMLHWPETTDGTDETVQPIPDSKQTDSKQKKVLDKTNTAVAKKDPFSCSGYFELLSAMKNQPAHKSEAELDRLTRLFFEVATEKESSARRLNKVQIRAGIKQAIKDGVPCSEIQASIAYLFSKDNVSKDRFAVKVYRSGQFNTEKMNQLLMKVDELSAGGSGDGIGGGIRI